MDLYPYQELYFTTLAYEDLQPLFGGSPRTLDSIGQNEQVMLLTGIASPKQLMNDLSAYTKNITPMTFADHHQFSARDIRRINKRFAQLPSPKTIITTEKDAVRLMGMEGLSDEVKSNIYQLPIRIRFMLEQEEEFNKKITGYVQKNSRNSILVKAKTEHKSNTNSRIIRFK